MGARATPAVTTPTPSIDPFEALPPPWVAVRYRQERWWRNQSILHDLVCAAATCPDRPAIISHRAQLGRTITVRYGELLRYVRRFAGALSALDIRRGDPVAYQLPNWWEMAALTLSCMWIGAVAVPIHPNIRFRELELILIDTRARLCVVPETWQGAEPTREFEWMAGRLPQLRHQVTYGESPSTSTIDFVEHFLNTPHEERVRVPPPLPSGQAIDRARLLMFTSGTTGRRKSVLHTENSLYAGIGAHATPLQRGWTQHEVFCTPHPITGLAGLLYTIWGPILAQGTGVYQDVWDADRLLDLLAEADVTQMFAAPAYLTEIIEATRRRPRDLPALRLVMTGAAPVPSGLVTELSRALSVKVRACWGMTEVGLGMRTREDDPDGWAAHSDGRPLPGLLADLRPVSGTDGLHRLWVRGPSVCSATWQANDVGEREVRTFWENDNGWFDTGDLVRDDGRGGMRFAGRASRRIGDMFMIPVEEVEKELRMHPMVREVAVIGHTDTSGNEQPCVVVAPEGRCPTLVELRDYLIWRGMTEWYLPTRLLEMDALPRNDNRKVDYDQLRVVLAEDVVARST